MVRNLLLPRPIILSDHQIGRDCTILATPPQATTLAWMQRDEPIETNALSTGKIPSSVAACGASCPPLLPTTRDEMAS